MDKIEALTRAEIREYKGEHLYVMNVSDHGSTRPRQHLLITFTINGAEVIIDVPNTWIPLDLTSRVNIAHIKENRDFWLFINRRDLAVVSQDTAEEYLDDVDAQAEYDRVFGIENDDRHSIVLNRNNSIKKKDRAPKGSMKVIAIMKRDAPEGMKLAALKNIKHELKPDDFRYILNEAKVGEHEKLKEWASSQEN